METDCIKVVRVSIYMLKKYYVNQLTYKFTRKNHFL